MTEAAPTSSLAARPLLRVLLMVRELNQGGVERDTAKMALHLDRRRFAPEVCCFFAEGLRYDELTAAGIEVRNIPVRNLLRPSVLGHAQSLRRLVRELRTEVIHAYDVSGILGAVAGRWAGVPVIITSQLSYRGLADPKTRALLRFSDRFTDAVVVNCEAMRRHMIDDEGMAPDRVELIYNGVDASVFFPAEQERPAVLDGSSLVIGSLCALRPEKGLQHLQEAFAQVKHLDPAMKLLIVGSGGELEPMKARAAQLGIADRTIFEPATAEAARWMRAMDVFVLPSLSEAFSNALLEAMACGRACVGSRMGGTPELTGEDERGLLFPPGDPAALAKCLERLITNPGLRRELGERAARFARENLTIQIAAERTGALYERLLRKKRDQPAR